MKACILQVEQGTGLINPCIFQVVQGYGLTKPCILQVVQGTDLIFNLSLHKNPSDLTLPQIT